MKPARVVVLLATLALASFAAAAITPGQPVDGPINMPIVVDLDGNGLDDLIRNDIVLLNQGGGNFVQRTLALTRQWESVTDWMDANGDGRADLLTEHREAVYPGSAASPAPPTYRLYIADGNGGFRAPVVAAEGKNNEPYIADVNGDGKDDLVMVTGIFIPGTQHGAGDITVRLSRGDGTFETIATYRMPTHPQFNRYGRHLMTGDMNRDGIRDLVLRTAEEIVVLRGTGGGHLVPEAHYLPSFFFGGWAMHVTDIDRDGKPDLISAAPSTIHVFYGDGRGGFDRTDALYLPQRHFPPTTPRSTYTRNSDSPRGLVLGEFVTRGRTEIAGGTAEGDLFVVAYENGKLREVSPRVALPVFQPDIFAGALRQPNLDDILITTPTPTTEPPRIYNTDPGVAPHSRSRARARAVSHPLIPQKKDLTVTVVDASACGGQASTLGVLTREGIFGTARAGVESFEAFIDGTNELHFRYRGPWVGGGVLHAALKPTAKGWAGEASAMRACGQPGAIKLSVER